ncbi:hypothetical protein ACFPYJ_09800 [Paenibacillus solisilvae]|uniref:Glycosyl hydrolase family 4 C-terminal domain-containing protein n=1 Tax=Paenibacillus solisilvae TaxID=2486751 RepID=A0ABW0VZ03_9BACL
MAIRIWSKRFFCFVNNHFPAAIINIRCLIGLTFSCKEGAFRPLAAIMRKLSDVHELTAEAAVKGDVEAARRAIELDPAVTDKQAGYEALNQMLKAHADLLPQFNV